MSHSNPNVRNHSDIETNHTYVSVLFIFIAQVPSPKKAVHVRSPLKYENGRLRPPTMGIGGNVDASGLQSPSQNKSVSSYNVIEGANGAGARKGNETT